MNGLWTRPNETSGSVRCRFWCNGAARAVDVVFETRGVPGLRVIEGVRRCSAIDGHAEIACDRRCVESAFRHTPGWPSLTNAWARHREARPAG